MSKPKGKNINAAGCAVTVEILPNCAQITDPMLGEEIVCT